MATQIFFTGDTIRLVTSFYDWAPVGTQGPALDPATVVVNTYNADYSPLQSGLSAVREQAGVYHYDWTLPTVEGTYYCEFVGTSAGEPTVIRTPVKVKFKGA